MKKRLWQFDYLKAISICLVIITHITYRTKPPVNVLFPYFIDMAVPIFMIISGFLNTKSCEERKKVTIREWFQWKQFFRKVKSIYLPFIIIWVVEIVFILLIQKETMNIKDVIYGLLTGGRGPGSYYTPILLQFVVIFPFIDILLRRKPMLGSAMLLLVQLLLEIGTQYLQIPVDIYRLLVFRYLIFIWLGIMLYRYGTQFKRRWVLLLGVMGGSYIFMVVYAGYVPHIFKYWTGTSMPTAMWAIFLVVVITKYLRRLPGKLDMAVRKIGESTYYIFLVQMVYYAFGIGNLIENILLRILINIVLCCSIGILFKATEDSITALIASATYPHKKTR